MNAQQELMRVVAKHYRALKKKKNLEPDMVATAVWQELKAKYAQEPRRLQQMAGEAGRLEMLMGSVYHSSHSELMHLYKTGAINILEDSIGI